MKSSLCGANCAACPSKDICPGCAETNGCPFGKQCYVAEYILTGGMAQTEQALASIKSGYLLIPAIILAVDAIIFFALFNLGKKMPQVQSELAARHSQK